MISIEELSAAYEAAILAIKDLKEEAENLRDELDSVIDACETLEDAL